MLTGPRWRSDDAAREERPRGGETEAFERIVRENRRAVYLMARRVLGRHDEADEATQIAFVRAWEARAKFRGASSVRTWLVRIALNVARSMQASRGRFSAAQRSEGAAEGVPGSDEQLRLRQLRQRVRLAVQALPERQREVVLLRVFSELTCRETAEVMGLSEGSVKAHLHQAVSNLRRTMRAEVEGERP